MNFNLSDQVVEKDAGLNSSWTFSNITAYQRPPGLQQLVNVLLVVDLIVRSLALLSHTAYFLTVFLVKKLRAFSLLYLHMVNLYGFLFILHFAFYMGSSMPNFRDEKLNKVLCSMSELVWAASKFLRSFSILLLAVFRMFAVKHNHHFKKWSTSTPLILSPIAMVIIVSVALVVATKFSFNTSHGPPFCYDGYTTEFRNGMNYFIVTSLLGIAIPSLLVITLYIIARRAMNTAQGSKRNSQKRILFFTMHQEAGRMVAAQDLKPVLRSPKHSRLTRQFFIVNLCMTVSLVTFTAVNYANLIPEFNNVWYHVRLMIRILAIFSQALVPITSFYGQHKLVRFHQMVGKK